MSVVRSELCPLGSVQEEVATDDCVPQR
jgi:hypothetical protein